MDITPQMARQELARRELARRAAAGDQNAMPTAGGASHPGPTMPNIPSTKIGGFGGAALNAGIGVANMAENAAVGFVGDAAKTGFNMAALATKAAGALGVPGATAYADKQQAADPIGSFTKPQTNTISGKVGELASETAQFAAPTGIITKGQKATQAAVDTVGLGGKVLPWIATKFAQIAPEAAVTGGTQYVKSGGDKGSAEGAALGAGILSSLTHVGSDVFSSIVPQTVKDNVGAFLKNTGKMTLKDVGTGKKVDDAVSAFTTLVRDAKNVKVVDENGVTKTWDPAKTTITELPQALYQTKNNIYKAYTDMATKSGDEKAMFGQKEFDALLGSLKKFSGKGYTQEETNQANKWIAAINRFGKMNSVDEKVYFKNTSPADVQKLLETVNKHADPRIHDTATATVANHLATEVRTALDDKITSSQGTGYQKLRTAYSQLKSVEKDVIERSKTALRQSSGGSISGDFLNGLATIDVLQGLVTGNPGLAARGTAIGAVKAFRQYLRSPEIQMQRALRMLSTGQEGGASGLTPGGLGDRFLGGAAKVVPTAGRAAAANTPAI